MVDYSCVGSVFHARSAATYKALLIRRHVHGTMRLPDDEARSADRAGTLATDVSKSEILHVGLHHEATIKHNLYWILSATGN